jgi:ferredoxin
MCASPSARTRPSSSGPEIYQIDPGKCTECVGHFDEPQCVQVCPVACIPLNPEHIEDNETLWRKYRRLTLKVEPAR